MVIATRVLKLRRGTCRHPSPNSNLCSPKYATVDWACRFEIDWPDETVELDAMGVDAVQALELALRMIGAFIYSSDHHAAAIWCGRHPEKATDFQSANNIRDLLVGDDKKSIG